jgi:hypothetical protein
MSRFDFSAVAPESVIKRGLRRLNPSRRSSQVVLWSAVAVAAVYTTGNPGQFTITTAADGGATSARFIQVQGAVENPSISAIQLHVKWSHAAGFRSRRPVLGAGAADAW